MNILYYDILRKQNITTESTHIYEVLYHLKEQGHNILFYNLNNESSTFKRAEIANVRPSLWGRLSNSWPLLGIVLICVSEGLVLLRGMIVMKNKKKPDIVYYRHALFNFGFLMAKWLGVPAIKEVNGIVANELQVIGAAGGFALEIINHIEKAHMGRADRIIVVTPRLKDVLVKQYGVPERTIQIIENGANTDMFRPIPMETVKKELKLDLHLSYICFVGNFTAWQGLEYLIRCAPAVLEACPDARFLLVGDGILKSTLSELAQELGISDMVIFTGMVPYEKVPLYINASELCVAPFIKNRNERIGLSPLKLYEYMACGKPVVASNITGVGDVLYIINAGIVIKPEQSSDIADGIIKLLKDTGLREEMGKNGREYVIRNHSWKNVASKLILSCKEII